jgi:hypothetical protein
LKPEWPIPNKLVYTLRGARWDPYVSLAKTRRRVELGTSESIVARCIKLHLIQSCSIQRICHGEHNGTSLIWHPLHPEISSTMRRRGGHPSSVAVRGIAQCKVLTRTQYCPWVCCGICTACCFAAWRSQELCLCYTFKLVHVRVRIRSTHVVCRIS